MIPVVNRLIQSLRTVSLGEACGYAIVELTSERAKQGVGRNEGIFGRNNHVECYYYRPLNFVMPTVDDVSVQYQSFLCND